jgi:hypothetical protein
MSFDRPSISRDGLRPHHPLQTLRLVAPSTNSLIKPRSPPSTRQSSARNSDVDRSAAAAFQAQERRRQRSDTPEYTSSDKEKLTSMCYEQQSQATINEQSEQRPFFRRMLDSLRSLNCHKTTKNVDVIWCTHDPAFWGGMAFLLHFASRISNNGLAIQRSLQRFLTCSNTTCFTPMDTHTLFTLYAPHGSSPTTMIMISGKKICWCSSPTSTKSHESLYGHDQRPTVSSVFSLLPSSVVPVILYVVMVFFHTRAWFRVVLPYLFVWLWFQLCTSPETLLALFFLFNFKLQDFDIRSHFLLNVTLP